MDTRHLRLLFHRVLLRKVGHPAYPAGVADPPALADPVFSADLRVLLSIYRTFIAPNWCDKGTINWRNNGDVGMIAA